MDPLLYAPEVRRRHRVRARQLATRAAIGTLGALAPGAAAESAARLMAHVGRPSMAREHDRLVHERARRGVIRVGTERVATYAWGDPDAPVVLLAHGWQMRAARMARLVAAFEEAGTRVLAFDAVAHGESSGRNAHLFQFSTALHLLADDVAAHGGQIAGVVGHSLGGLAAGVAVRDGLPAPRWVAVNSPASLTSTGEVFAAMVGMPRRLVPALIDAASRRFLENASAAWADGDLVARPAPPSSHALFVRDVDDVMTPSSDARRLHAAHPGSDLLVTGGLGHNRVLDDPEVCGAVVAHVTGATARVS